MSFRADISIDWEVSPRIITVASPSVEVTMQDLYDTLRTLEAQQVATDDPAIVSGAGKENLGGGVKVGLTITLLNARLAFEARPGPDYVQCNIAGGNLVAIDDVGADMNPIEPTAFTQIVLANSSSATLQEQSALQYASFGGGVTFDETSPYSGTEYPVGTPQQPVNNWDDAHLISVARGFPVFFVIGNTTLGTTYPYTGHVFVGESRTKTTITVPAVAVVTGCEFEEAHILGTLDGNSRLAGCKLDNLEYVNGEVEDCILAPGAITLGGGAEALFERCISAVAGTGTPCIDMGGTGQTLVVRHYSGGISMRNKTGTESTSIDLDSGQCVLEDTVTAGTIVVRGDGKLVDIAGDYIMSGLWNGATIVNETSSGKMTQEVWQLLALDPNNPLTISDAQQTVGDIVLNVVDNGTETTVTRV